MTRQSIGERSLHTGEVVGSIPTAPTTKAQQFIAFFVSALPFPPPLDREQSVFSPSILGENPGSLFDWCSARNRATTPWRPPAEPGNGSPGAVGTATGAEVQSFVEEANQSCLKPNVNVQSAATLRTERSAFLRRHRTVRRRYYAQPVARPLIAGVASVERGAAP